MSMDELRRYLERVESRTCSTCGSWRPDRGGRCTDGPYEMAAGPRDSCGRWK